MRLPLRVMQPVSVHLPGTDPAEWHATMILDFVEHRFIQIGVLMEHGTETRLSIGTTVGLKIPLPDGIRQCESVVESVEESPPSVRLRWPEDAERIQRRENVRVEALFKAEVRVHLGDANPVLTASTTDISVGGVRLSLSESLPAGARLTMRIQLADLGWREVKGRVLRSGEKPGGPGGNPFWAAVEFQEIPAALRRELTKLVFDIEREHMRKGVG